MDRRTFLKTIGYSSGALLGQPLWLTGCSTRKGVSGRQPRLVLLYAPCSVNKFHLSPYNPKVTYTPSIERFAAESSVFTKHQTESGQSGIAYASIFSGSQADRHNVFDHPRRISDSVYQIAEAFAQNTYGTYFWNAHGMAHYDIGYGKGVPRQDCFLGMLTAEDERFDKILGWLSSDKDYQAFIVTSFMKTHSLYARDLNEKASRHVTLPAEFASVGVTVDEYYRYRKLYFSQRDNRFLFSFDFAKTVNGFGLSKNELAKFIRVVEYLYKCAIHNLDKLFGKVIAKLDARGLLDESLVIFTADHGETLYRDNTLFKFTHGFQLAPEVLSVPLIIRAPSLGVEAKTYSSVSRSIDVFPTAAGLCGLRIPEDRKPAGIDLSASVTGKAPPPSLPAFSHTALVDDNIAKRKEYQKALFSKFFLKKDPNLMWVCVRIDDMVFKLARFDADIEDFAPFAFDLEKDPTERNNLFDPDNERHMSVLNELEQYRDNLVSAYQSKTTTTESGITEQERIKRLKALGYL